MIDTSDRVKYGIIIGAAMIVAAVITGVFTVKKDKDQQSPLQKERREITIILNTAPDDWGKPILGSFGKLICYDNSQGSFVGRIELTGLKPNSNYLLTINGKPAHRSNDLLPQRYKEKEGYYDITQISTDPKGRRKPRIQC